MLRPTTAGFAARTVRLLLLPTLTAIALACDDSTSPPRPPAADKGAPTRADASGFPNSATHWADGYLEANLENLTSPYSPSPYISFNRAGRGTITITKVAGTTGRYVATFTGLSALLGGRSTVHVTSRAGQETACKPAAAYLVSDKVEVRCFKLATGAPENALFTMLVTRNYGDLAFAYAHQETATNYAPSSQGSWNPAGTMNVVRTGLGQYRVTFNNLLAQLPPNVLGNVQVNAVGTSNAYCNAHNWGGATTGTPNLFVDVRCYEAPTGAPVDRRFTVLFVLPSDHLAYAWADKPTLSTYAPIAYYSTNPAGGPITITREAVGSYKVAWAGADPWVIDEGTAQVTAYGGNAQCKLSSVGDDGGAQFAYVLCFAPNGTRVDSRFMVLSGS